MPRFERRGSNEVSPIGKTRARSQIVGGLAASYWMACDPIHAAVKFAATGLQFVLISG